MEEGRIAPEALAVLEAARLDEERVDVLEDTALSLVGCALEVV